MSASKQLPYFPIYTGDFLRTTAGWTFEEKGAFLLLLMKQWDARYLPDDTERLAKIVGVEHAKFIDIWRTVGQEFTIIEARGFGPELYNAALDERRRQYESFRKKQSEGGLKGAERRWGIGNPWGDR